MRCSGNEDAMSTEPVDERIEQLHQEAVDSGAQYYIDPETGLLTMTASYHLDRGECCKSDCRHCPYNEDS